MSNISLLLLLWLRKNKLKLLNWPLGQPCWLSTWVRRSHNRAKFVSLIWLLSEVVPPVKERLENSLKYLKDTKPGFSGLTFVLVEVDEFQLKAKIKVSNDTPVGCSKSDLVASGFPMEIIKYGYPFYRLPLAQRKVFCDVQSTAGRHEINIFLDSNGSTSFAHKCINAVPGPGL